eukprot:jgi/Ulvmu1/2747/UM014_0204.1
MPISLCDPYDLDRNEGLVEVVEIKRVEPSTTTAKGDDSNDSRSRTKTGLKLRHATVGDFKTKVEKRAFIREVKDEQGKVMEGHIEAAIGGNTEAAEQCLKELRMSSPTSRKMGVCRPAARGGAGDAGTHAAGKCKSTFE